VLGYRFQGTPIAVASDAAAVLHWLDEFLAPSFEAWRGDAADFAVRIHTRPEAHAELVATRPPGALRELACFALDREVVAHPAWTDRGRTVLSDGRLGALYRLGEREVDVVAEPRSTAPRTAVMRVVREIATSGALASGERLQLHAAVLARHGRALAIAGPKGAGKTTLLAYLASEGGGRGVRILTNDRALATPTPAGFDVVGVPTIVSVRPESLAFVPRLAQGVPDVERPGHLSLAEFDAALAERGALRAPRRLKLSLPQLARQLGVSLGACAPLAAIVFPEPAEGVESFVLARLDPDDATRRLAGALFGVHSGRSGPTVFERLVGAVRPADADRRVVAGLAAGTPCFSLRIGAARYGDPGAARSLLATCLEA
jgi:hypothetical protein